MQVTGVQTVIYTTAASISPFRRRNPAIFQHSSVELKDLHPMSFRAHSSCRARRRTSKTMQRRLGGKEFSPPRAPRRQGRLFTRCVATRASPPQCLTGCSWGSVWCSPRAATSAMCATATISSTLMSWTSVWPWAPPGQTRCAQPSEATRPRLSLPSRSRSISSIRRWWWAHAVGLHLAPLEGGEEVALRLFDPNYGLFEERRAMGGSMPASSARFPASRPPSTCSLVFMVRVTRRHATCTSSESSNPRTEKLLSEESGGPGSGVRGRVGVRGPGSRRFTIQISFAAILYHVSTRPHRRRDPIARARGAGEHRRRPPGQLLAPAHPGGPVS